MNEYEALKQAIYKEGYNVSRRLEKEPSNKSLLGAWQAITSIIDDAGLLDDFNEYRDKKYIESRK